MNIEIPSEVRRIQQSQLVTPQQLQDTIMRVLTMNRAITETSVLNELVEEGLISLYQSRQIRGGRFKGFFFEQYKFLNVTRYPDNNYVAEALDMTNGRYVLLNATFCPNFAARFISFLSMREGEGLPLVSEEARLEKKNNK